MASVVGVFHYATDPTHPDHLDTQSVQRLETIAPFFDGGILDEAVVPFLNVDAPLSLRHLSHLVNHMAPRDGVMWTTTGGAGAAGAAGGACKTVDLWAIFRKWLHVWKRRLFDPFRRNARVYFRHHRHGEPAAVQWQATTVAQLNFFYFAKLNGVLSYARAHRDNIDADMKAWNEHRRDARRRGVKPETPVGRTSVSLQMQPRVMHFE